MEKDKLPKNNKLTVIHRRDKTIMVLQSVDNKRKISLFKVSDVTNLLVNPCLWRISQAFS